MGKLKNLLKDLSLLITTICFCLFFLEIFIIYKFPDWISEENSPYIFYSYDSNLGWVNTKNSQGGIFKRPEFEYEIPLNDAESILKLSKNSIIKKTRFTIHHQGQIWEIDQFEGDNQGLVIAEIELKQKDEAISLPNWIGTEISNDDRFYNLSLSINPFKNWK